MYLLIPFHQKYGVGLIRLLRVNSNHLTKYTTILIHRQRGESVFVLAYVQVVDMVIHY